MPDGWSMKASREAASSDRPIVVLESTVIAQGLPWPENLETALEMEAAVRDGGAVPATIAILDGIPRIGLSRSEIERVARSANQASRDAGTGKDPRDLPGGAEFVKANRRDLSVILARGGCAATTVSATLWLAQRSGLRPCVMATGGLGGVHRGAGLTFDVSTDLDELARADGAVVVCSGFKSILDVEATVESLETRGVAIRRVPHERTPRVYVGFDRPDARAPGGLSGGGRNGHSAPSRAAIARGPRTCQPRAGGPCGREGAPGVGAELRARGRRARKISGKAITPFLLDAIRAATGGQSLLANRALLVANARLAAEVAAALHGGKAGESDVDLSR